MPIATACLQGSRLIKYLVAHCKATVARSDAKALALSRVLDEKSLSLSWREQLATPGPQIADVEVYCASSNPTQGLNFNHTTAPMR